jgi:hypothetical protein
VDSQTVEWSELVAETVRIMTVTVLSVSAISEKSC